MEYQQSLLNHYSMQTKIKLLYNFFYIINFILYNLSIFKIISFIKIVFYAVLKKDTKYPSYLIKYENSISNLNKKKYTLTFSSGTQAFESLFKSLDIKDKKIGIGNIVFPSIFGAILRYIDLNNLRLLSCNKDLVIDVNENYEIIKNLDYLVITFGYGYPYNDSLINKIFEINNAITLIYDLSHCQGYSNIKNKHNQQVHYFFSTQGSKAISTGEGGIVSTDSHDIYKKMMFNSHINRMDNILNLSEKEKIAMKIGVLSKSRLSPLGAISGLNDLHLLKKNNRILREKIAIIYKEFEKIDKVYLPKVNNFDNLTGFHYGIPFLLNPKIPDIQKKETILLIKKYFRVLDYNWLSEGNLRKFIQDDNFKKFQNYNFDFLQPDQNFEEYDILGNLNFIDLNDIKYLPKVIIKSSIKKISQLIINSE